MIDPKKIEQIARQVHESMPKGLRDLGEDVEKKIRQALQSQLTRLDLVSREEFDVQTQVLLRTREKLALLEQRLNDLETARRRRRAAKSSSKKRAPGGPFCVWLNGRLPPDYSPGDSTVHSAGKTIHDVLHPYCRQWPEDQLAGPGRAFWRNSAPKNQNSSLNTYRYGSCAYSFSGGCSDQSYAFYSLQYLRLP